MTAPWLATLLVLTGLLIGVLAGLWIGTRRSRALEIRNAVLEAQVKTQSQLESERQLAQEQALEGLRSSFEALANSSLRNNSELFLQLARERLGLHQQAATNALAEREKAIEAMLLPIREALFKTERQITAIEKERAETFGALRAAIEAVSLGQQALQKETRTLVNSLRRPEVRGRWGEMTLRRLAELAGMIEHCDFSEQVQVRSDEGSLRPDMVVHMPDGRDLVVDVKTPLDAYLEANEATNDELRAVALRRHANALAERIRQLSNKSYWSQFARSPDFVILFIPGDQFLAAALEQTPTLLEDAIRQNVIIATPTSFVALLKAVAYGWRQTALAENAASIRRLAEDLYRRLGVFAGHLTRLGRALGSGVDAYNSAVGSLERQVLPGARKFTEMGVQADKPIEPLEAIDRLTRTPTLPFDDEGSPRSSGQGE